MKFLCREVDEMEREGGEVGGTQRDVMKGRIRSDINQNLLLSLSPEITVCPSKLTDEHNVELSTL